MLPYCLKCKNKTESKNPTVVQTKSRRIMLLSSCVLCNSKQSRKGQEASGLLISLEVKTSVSKIPVVSSLLFYRY